MTDLVEFLRARLAEDEQAVQWAIQYSGLRGRGVAECWEVVRDGNEGRRLRIQTRYEALPPKPVVAFDDPAFHRPLADFIARHDPARVLREVERDRRIINVHAGGHECASYDFVSREISNGVWVMDGDDCTTVRLLALPYADHPEFREEWTTE